jgi:hypothetical protein
VCGTFTSGSPRGYEGRTDERTKFCHEASRYAKRVITARDSHASFHNIRTILVSPTMTAWRLTWTLKKPLVESQIMKVAIAT